MDYIVGDFQGEYIGYPRSGWVRNNIYEIKIVRGSITNFHQTSSPPTFDGPVHKQDFISSVIVTQEPLIDEATATEWKESSLTNISLYNFHVEPFENIAGTTGHRRGFIRGYIVAPFFHGVPTTNTTAPSTPTSSQAPTPSLNLKNFSNYFPTLRRLRLIILALLSVTELSPEVLHILNLNFYDLSIVDMMDEEVNYDFDNDGIRNAIDDCPYDPEDFDGFEDSDGCPDNDNDQDGVVDTIDKCPMLAGYNTKGCPHITKGKLDTDGDGIANDQDLCPDEPETWNKYNDFDGCPDTIPDSFKDLIGRQDAITFQKNSAAINPSSFHQLRSLQSILDDNTSIHLLIEGHTDNSGTDEFNLHLSQQRANAIRDWFIAQGVGKSRLHSRGYGRHRPEHDNNTPEGRKANRRVEFACLHCKEKKTHDKR